LVRKIQLRLTAIITSSPKRPPSLHQPPRKRQFPRTPPLEEIVAESQHMFAGNASHSLHCTLCGFKSGEDSKSKRELAMSKCSPRPLHLGQVTFCDRVWLGHIMSHPSHHLVCLRGVYACTVCGNVASRKLQALASACSGLRTYYGLSNLKALEKGTLPPPLAKYGWPEVPAQELTVEEASAYGSVLYAVNHFSQVHSQTGNSSETDSDTLGVAGPSPPPRASLARSLDCPDEAVEQHSQSESD
jgi:hypothetical protein